MLRRLFSAGREAIASVHELLAGDDVLLCGCWGDQLCADCALERPSPLERAWPAAPDAPAANPAA